MTNWLLRMARWAHRPPSQRRVVMVIAIIAISLAIVGLEHMGWWPDWAQAGRMRR